MIHNRALVSYILYQNLQVLVTVWKYILNTPYSTYMFRPLWTEWYAVPITSAHPCFDADLLLRYCPCSTGINHKILYVFWYLICILNHALFLKLNLLKPTGYVMHQQLNIQQLYVLPTLYLCVLYLSENKQRLVPLTA